MTVRTIISGLMASLGQSVLSMSFDLAGLLAGTLLALYLGVFSLAPWALALFPGVLSIRGSIGGLFSGRLSTALHVGTIRASYTKNTKNFYLLIHAVIMLTFVSSVALGLAASLFGVVLWKATITDSVDMLMVMITTMGLSLIFIPPITIGVSILSFKHGLDPDVMIYPITSTTDDVIVTICYILVLNVFFWLTQLGRYLLILFDIIFFSIACYLSIKNYREREFVKTVKEFLITLILVAFIVNVTGSILSRIHAYMQVVGSKPEVYVVYPALIDTIGGVGSIVGSTATTKLALGLLSSSFSSIRNHLTEIGGAWMASLVMFTLYSMISFLTRRITVLDDLMHFMAQLLVTNLLAVSLIVIISYAVAILTYRRGWDPDNFVIPIESSLADGITTVSLLIALTMIV